MLIPGFSSPRVEVQVRLFIAIGIALALTPLQIDMIEPLVAKATAIDLLFLIFSESLKGMLIGLLGRFYFIAIETISMAIAMSIGLSANLGAPVNEDEPLPAIVSLITLFATLLVFVTDLHWEVFRGLAASYVVLPVRDAFAARSGLVQLTDSASRTFALALRIGSPFLIFSLVTNVALGLTNKLVPQIQVSFLAGPFLIVGGLFIFYLTAKPSLALFVEAFGSWLLGH
jgi:flagellar biosynthetic protein FliR